MLPSSLSLLTPDERWVHQNRDCGLDPRPFSETIRTLVGISPLPFDTLYLTSNSRNLRKPLKAEDKYHDYFPATPLGFLSSWHHPWDGYGRESTGSSVSAVVSALWFLASIPTSFGTAWLAKWDSCR
ncbi:hypothetical protein GYMLUDRAFT_253581 [Collybiopsis luxurians FD-317 M1]|uniref:Uncharacterized protein n=1 Tax=Collybiopsis luxurians FD-317 M1 TaxID=944289 RepID=A0A0D0BW43_9AGAR|nr:hypothetical protein GYMLUDRAFT_253581 [Collybiopsis luxurians FD-317 M1]